MDKGQQHKGDEEIYSRPFHRCELVRGVLEG